MSGALQAVAGLGPAGRGAAIDNVGASRAFARR